MSTNKIGKVLKLFISLEGESNRIVKKNIALDEKGVLKDKFYNKDIQRSVLITSIDSYTLIEKNNIEISYGALGENLLIDYNPYDLPIGSKLQIGEVVLAISQNCTLCNHLSKIDKQLPKLLRDDRGIFAKVIKSGTIKSDDTISLLNH